MNFLKNFAIVLFAILFSISAFSVTYPSIEGIQDISLDTYSGSTAKIVDLRNYSHDDISNPSSLFYKIESQSNIHLIDCFIEDDYYVSCTSPEYNTIGMSTITVKVVNSFGLTDTDSFNINVTETEAKGVIFSVDRQKVFIEKNDSINVQFTVENDSAERKEFNVKTILDHNERDELRVDSAIDSFYLNAREKTTFTVTISSFNDSRSDNYDVEVELTYPNSSKTIVLEVEINEDENPLDLVRVSDYYVCKDSYTQEIEVRLENNSSRTQTIELSADHELLMPYFEFSETTLSSGDYDVMSLKFHTNSTTAFTKYTIPVFIRSENYFVERDITFRLVECEENFFDLSVTPEEKTIERDSRAFFRVKLTSQSNEDQEIRLSSDGDLPSELEDYTVLLRGNSVEYIDLEISARESDDDGLHNIKVYAWNSNETEEENVKVKVKSEHDFELLVETNDFEARICSPVSGQVFEILVINKGDYDEEIEFSLSSVDESIQALVSDNEIELEANGQQKIYVFVNPTFGTPIGNYSITLNADSGRKEITKQLRFKVVETEEELKEGVIEFVNYPKEVTFLPGEEKNLSFTIKNPLSTKMNNVSLRVYGLGTNVSVSPVSINSLDGKETFTFVRKAKAGAHVSNKIYDATVEVRADGYVSTTKMKIKVTSNPQNEDEEEDKTGLLTGFSVLFTGEIMLGGAIILILLIAILLGLSLLNSNKSDDIAAGKSEEVVGY